MTNGLHTAHEVAVILADAFGDDCACNFLEDIKKRHRAQTGGKEICAR